ncbi:MAG: hypothetical protein NZ822_01580 [Patescibacteria group bacterium]|nr:hypothetical protein [Patescibacteria group bacterium]
MKFEGGFSRRREIPPSIEKALREKVDFIEVKQNNNQPRRFERKLLLRQLGNSLNH